MFSATFTFKYADTNPLKVGTQVYRSANDWNLNEFDLEIAQKELNETEEKKTACLQEMKLRLKRERIYFPEDEAYLLRYLRVRKYDCEKACESILSLYRIRNKYPNLFALRPNMQSFLKEGIVTYLPYTDEEGRISYVVRYDKMKIGVIPTEDYLSAVLAVCDIVNLNPHCQINGTILIWNVKGISWRHMAALLKLAALVIEIAQESYAWRIKKIIIIHCSPVIQYMYKLLRYLVKKKFYERCVFLGSDLREFHEIVNPCLLPKDLGGKLEDEECNVTEHIMENLPFLKYERSFGSEIS